VNIIRTRNLRSWFLVLALFGTTSPSSNAKQQNRVDVQYEPKEAGFTLHAPVTMFFKVQNGSGVRVTLDLGIEKTDAFEFSLTTPEGRVVQSGPLHPTGGFFPSGTVVVEPGTTYEQELLLNRWFQFKTPGTYLLASRLTTDMHPSGDASSPPRSQITRLLIRPRDPVQLEKVCAELADQVEAARSVEAAAFPALELSYVEDPIAVPYLARVMRSHSLAYDRAIPGLERIGNDDAIEVLLSAINNSYGGITDLATRALARMQDQITNPRLKDAAKKAVEHSKTRARDAFIKEQIAYLDYRDPHLQNSAIENLTKVEDGLHQAEPVLQRLTNDLNQPADVRAAAKDALKKLHPPQ
jgi:hypothetical protein